MTMTQDRPTTTIDPIAAAIADAEGVTIAAPQATDGQPAKLHDILIINYSGELEKVWATMLLASTAGAMQVPCRVFVTFWGLQNFVKDEKRITGRNWMQKMLAMMSRPGISHRPLSKMNFMGLGPWMMGTLARQQKNASPKELLAIAQEMGVEFIPCQMTMDMFGLTRDDLVEGMGEPVGAATVIGLMSEGSAPLFI
jgi:peroxiredoxin family protein